MRQGAFKLHFFLLYAVVGAYLPYLPVFLDRDLGLPDWQIGWVTGCYGLSVLLAPPVFATLADRQVSGRTLVASAYAGAALALTLIALAVGFVDALLLSLLFSLCYTPLISLIDGLVFAEMSRERAAGGSPPAYSALRVWGSFGFMAPAAVLFVLLQRETTSGRVAMLVSAVAAVAALLCARLLPRHPPEERAAGLPAAAAWAVLRRAPTRSLVGALVLLFAAIAVFYAFYPRLVIEVGFAPAWVGVLTNLGVLAELPFLLLAAGMLRRFRLRTLMLFGAGCLAARMLILAALPNPTTLIVTQVLHGPVVVSLYLLPPMILDHKAEPSFRTSVQGLFAALCYGAARVVGSGLSGHAAEYGLPWAFAFGAVCAAAATLWLAAAWRDPEAELALRPGAAA